MIMINEEPDQGTVTFYIGDLRPYRPDQIEQLMLPWALISKCNLLRVFIGGTSEPSVFNRLDFLKANGRRLTRMMESDYIAEMQRAEDL